MINFRLGWDLYLIGICSNKEDSPKAKTPTFFRQTEAKSSNNPLHRGVPLTSGF